MKEKFKKIKLVAFDVDGVMTDGTISYTSSGEEIKSFNAKDGQGINLLAKAGFITVIITARTSPVVERRAKELGMSHVFQGSKNKLETLDKLLEEYSLNYENVLYMGDDLPDLKVMEKVGLACCPNDAVRQIKVISHFVSSKDGGRGAVREVCDILIKS